MGDAKGGTGTIPHNGTRSPMDIEIRTITEQEKPAYGRSLERAFSEHWTEQDWKVEHNVFEVERSLAAFDAGEIVGTTGAGPPGAAPLLIT